MKQLNHRLAFFCVLMGTICYGQTALPPPAHPLDDTKQQPSLSLEDFEAFAEAANPTLGEARAATQASAGRARQAGLLPNPSVGYQGEQIRGGSYGGGEQGAFIQQNIVLGGKLGLRKKAAEQQQRADEIASEEQRVRVRSGVAQSFYSALAAQESVGVRKRLLDLANDAVETAHGLANVGQADEPDVLQAEVEAAQASVDYLAAQRNYAARFRTLATVAGKPALAVAPLKGQLKNLPAIDSDHVVEKIVAGSPTLKRARQEVARAEAEWRAARREVVPDLEVRGGLEQNNESLALNQPRAVGVEGFATVGVSLPLFNRNQGNIAAAEAELGRTRAETARAELALRRDASQLREEYLTRLDEAKQYREQMLPRANRAYELYLAKYKQMGAAYPQVLIAQRTLFQLQVAYVGTLEQLWEAAIELANDGLSGALAAPGSNGREQESNVR